MTNRNQRLRWIAAVLVVVGLLALVAWWRWPVSRGKQTQPTRMAAANTSRAIIPESGVERTGPLRQTLEAIADVDAEDNSAEQACNRDYRAELRDYRAQLGPAHTADETIDRLLLDFLAANPADWMSDAIGREYQEARRRWPDDVELAWLAVDNCNADCDREAEIRHLLSVDPDNAAAWMVAMGAARQRHDLDGFGFALRRANKAKIYDQRTGIVFLHLRKVLVDVPQPASCQATELMASMQKDLGRAPTKGDLLDGLAGSVELAIALPAFTGVGGCSDANAPLSESTRKSCVALLSRVANGDTLLEQVFATSLLIRLQSNPASLGQLRERYRQLQWLMAISREKPFPENYFARIYADGEVAATQAIATERGQWPPPPDWLPDNPRARALILGEDQPPP